MSEGENMVERCARALWEAPPYGHERMPWDDLVKRAATDAEFAAAAEDQRQSVRAVIEALMTPTPEMVDAAMDNYDIRGWGQVRWTPRDAMTVAIKAALRTSISKPNEEGEGK